ncbi:hypothetical protein [Candidatus Sarmatiella mevalonica]|uniref:hypothetical protein n=1 Tax=Candidatus Sarmatiella mevalonica TaxID=2770581 RepID=UPI001923B18E|nr:hypothetical protein [Candidatus Sarmatiella mevalonica]
MSGSNEGAELRAYMGLSAAFKTARPSLEGVEFFEEIYSVYTPRSVIPTLMLSLHKLL